jgi:hypothetical protein
MCIIILLKKVCVYVHFMAGLSVVQVWCPTVLRINVLCKTKTEPRNRRKLRGALRKSHMMDNYFRSCQKDLLLTLELTLRRWRLLFTQLNSIWWGFGILFRQAKYSFMDFQVLSCNRAGRVIRQLIPWQAAHCARMNSGEAKYWHTS